MASHGSAAEPLMFHVPGWGKVLDPDADCKFLVERDRLTFHLPGVDHSFSIERGKMNSPRTIAEVRGDFTVQVRVSGNFPDGAVPLVQGRRAFHGAGLYIWKDDQNYVRLERAKLSADGRSYSYASFELRQNGEFVRMGNAAELELMDADVELRLVRRGGEIMGYISKDGENWSALRAIEVEFPETLVVGVCAGTNTASGFSPQFEKFQILPKQ